MSSKTYGGAALVGLLSSLLLAVPAAVGQPRLPPNEYACQVRDQAGTYHLVLVQADDMARAAVVAEEARLRVTGFEEAGLVTVVECIDRNRGSFRDRGFQRTFRAAEL